MEKKIESFLATMPENKRGLTLRLRDIFLKADRSVTEDIKWGNLTFISSGNIAFIYTYKSVPYINVGFMRALELDDPKKLFEGTGKSMRHIKVESEKDIPARQLTSWIKQSVTLNKEASAKKKPAVKSSVQKTSSPKKKTAAKKK